MQKYILCLCFFVAILLPTQAQYKVFPLHVGDSLTENRASGYSYALPMNYFRVEVKLNRTNRYPGPFAEYAERMLGLSGAIREASVEYAVKSVNVQLMATEDTSCIYYVEFPKCMKDVILIPPVRQSVLSDEVKFSVPDEQARARFEMYDNYTLIEKYDTTYERRMVDSEWVSVPKIHKKMVEKTTAQKAEEALKKIKAIREAQWLLLTGDHEVDFSNLEYMVSELKKEEETHLSLYSGFSVSEEESVVFSLMLPAEKKDEYLIPLFTFSSVEGIFKGIASKKDGEIYQLGLSNAHRTDALAGLTAQQAARKEKQQGFRYRVPEYYKVNVLRSAKVIQEVGTMPVSQYGVVRMLPSDVSSLQLDPLTGEVQSVHFSSQK